MDITNHRLARAGATAVLAGALAAATWGAADPASAATINAHPTPNSTVYGCAQSYSTSPGTCITVVTGAKNDANDTQYVDSITIAAPAAATSAGQIQAWAGNGPTGVAWYKSGTGLSESWTIDASIKTKSGICGEYTYPGTSTTSEACITITVP